MMDYEKYFHNMIKEILSERDRIFKELSNIKEIELYKSDSNSIFFKTEKSKEIFDKMLEEKILIRKFKGKYEKYLRISIGKKEENNKVLSIIKDVFN